MTDLIDDDELAPEPDWQAKFLKAVADNVRQSDAHKAKQAGTLVELQQARLEIERLRTDVRRMEPADAKRQAAEAAQLASVNGYERQLRELRQTNADLRAQILRGQRGAMEVIAGWINDTAKRYPKPLSTDEPFLLPEETS